VRDFYVGVLGFDVVMEARDVPGWGTTGDVLFLSAGGYHHHLGVNVWRGHGVRPEPRHTAGLRHWHAVLPEAADVEAVRARVDAAGLGAEQRPGGFLVRDPWGIPLLVSTAAAAGSGDAARAGVAAGVGS
jgi:catechol-2,3-dioxygenase